MRSARRNRSGVQVGPGERVLAATLDTDGRAVAGTRDALYAGLARIPWEQVEAADWDSGTAVLTVTEIGSWGAPRPKHRFTFADPGRLLELVRERVTSTVVLQRHVPIRGRLGLRVIARRAPSGDRPLTWLCEYDAGIDPADPTVRAAAEGALAQAQEEVGSA